MQFDTTLRLTDFVVGGSVIIAALKVILTNRDILKGLIKTAADHGERIKKLEDTQDKHNDVLVRNMLDLRADHNLRSVRRDAD